ncbi:uncharacterized protein TNCV_3548581 [Trichonephila clavipes]|nr:uncharacterized protein TNCV_3548581 [Trichonephila clavipes]
MVTKRLGRSSEEEFCSKFKEIYETYHPLTGNAPEGCGQGFQECDEEDVENWMACDKKDCGFHMLNDDEIVTSVQEESNPVDDETDENEDNSNNESRKGPSNADGSLR